MSVDTWQWAAMAFLAGSQVICVLRLIRVEQLLASRLAGRFTIKK